MKTVINTISGQSKVSVKIAHLIVKILHQGDLKAHRLEGVKFVHGQHLSKVKVADPKFCRNIIILNMAAKFAPFELNMV